MPAGTLSNPFPAMPVAPSIVLVSPVVAVLVTEFTPPVVRPTPLLTVPVTAFEACPTTPGFLAVGVVAGVLFFIAAGVGFVPSAFMGDLTAGVVFFTGVVLVAVEVEFVAVFAGVVVFGVLSLGAEPEAFFKFGPAVRVRTGDVLDAGMAFFATGVCAGALVALLTAGLLVVTGVFFTDVTPDVLGPDGTVFFTAVGVVVAFTGGVFFAGLALADTGVAVLLSFAGVFFTGVTDAPADLVAVVAVFFTGVAAFCVVDGAVLDADDGVFFVEGEPPPAAFWRFATPATTVRFSAVLQCCIG